VNGHRIGCGQQCGKNALAPFLLEPLRRPALWKPTGTMVGVNICLPIYNFVAPDQPCHRFVTKRTFGIRNTNVTWSSNIYYGSDNNPPESAPVLTISTCE
jgi:hypothetical protein